MSTLDLNDFILQDKIGSGSFGQVFKVMEKKSGIIYAAKIAFRPLDEGTEADARNFSREITILSRLNHPAILKFIGFNPEDFLHNPCPVIITELVSNGTLFDIINLERTSNNKEEWNDTRKLINIYGIASAMSYLHLHNIIHRDLKPANILMDEFLCPKVADFGLSKLIHSEGSLSVSQSTTAIKGTPIYIAPEIWSNYAYTPKCDVYAFGIIVYEIVTSLEPYKTNSFFEICSKITRGDRPTIDNLVPIAYKNLIESCWAQDPSERPEFSRIVEELKTDKQFITDLVVESDFYDYIDYLENYQKDREPQKIDEFLGHTTQTFKKVKIDELLSSSSNFVKEKSIVFPSKQLKQLPEECRKLVQEADEDAEKQFEVGQSLIEGTNNFKMNTELGIRYIDKSAKSGNIESSVYLARLLIENEIIPQDLERAKSVLERCLDSDDSLVFLLYGKILRKMEDYEKARGYFEKSAKAGNAEAMYEYGKMCYRGLGCAKNEKEAMKYFMMAKKNGFDKSDKFLGEEKVPTDKKELFGYYKKKADCGDADSMIKCAYALLEGDGIDADKAEAARYFRMAAEKGSVEAMLKYGTIVREGDGVPVNKAEAAEYIKKAADCGNDEAIAKYGLMLLNGDGIPANKAEAANYLKKAADGGNDEAIAKYGLMLLDGDGIPMNKAEAANYLKKAADGGNDEAIAKYGLMLFKGDGIPANKVEAANYLKKGVAKGNDVAIAKYSLMLLTGDGVPMNKAEALHYVKHLLDKGNELGFSIYASMLVKGDGVAKNTKEAARYYQIAVDKGSTYAMANLAGMYKRGEGVEVNIQRSVSLYKMAIDKGDLQATINYATMLRDGDKVNENKPEAARLFKVAMEKGDQTAAIKYAIMLRDGDGIQCDKKESLSILKKLADEGNIEAKAQYGWMMYDLDGVRHNYSEALKYIKEAVEGGNALAFGIYGSMHLDGIVVERNYKEAARYLKMSADKGCGYALNKIGNMYSDGIYFDQSDSESIRYYKLGMEAGYMNSFYNMGNLYRYKVFRNLKKTSEYYLMAIKRGSLIAMNQYANMFNNGEFERNVEMTVKYYKMAIERGYPNSMWNLANMYREGNGVRCDKQEAIRLYKMAIEQDYPPAMYSYGRMLLKGEGIEQNKEEGIKYIKMAAEKGDSDAESFLNDSDNDDCCIY